MSKGHRISKTITANMIIFCAQTGNLLWTHRSNGECDNGIHNEWCVKQLCDSLPRQMTFRFDLQGTENKRTRVLRSSQWCSALLRSAGILSPITDNNTRCFWRALWHHLHRLFIKNPIFLDILHLKVELLRCSKTWDPS